MTPVAYAIEVAIGIGLLIFVHELGHFIVAKLSKVKVEKFSLGFGPEIVGFTGGETRYSIRIILLGGYVKMLGDEPGVEVAPADRGRSFLTQGFRVKALIVVAGSFMNIITALLLFIVVFRMGIAVPAPRIGTVEYGAPAFYAGLKSGDRIVSVNGARVAEFTDLAIQSALAQPGQKISIGIQRGTRPMVVTVSPTFDPDSGLSAIGITPYPTLKVAGFAIGEDGRSTSREAGLQPGWTITSFNGDALSSPFDLERRISANGLKPYTLAVTKDGARNTVRIRPVRNKHPMLGVIATQTTLITDVTTGSLAAALGLESSDAIVALGQEKEDDLSSLGNDINESITDLPPLHIIRDGKPLEIPWTKQPASAFAFLDGIKTAALTRLAWVQSDSPADVMGLRPGDVITSVDGKPAVAFQDIQQALKASRGDSIGVTWKRGEVEMSGSFEPVFDDLLQDVEMVKLQLGLADSCKVGVQKAWSFASQMYLFLKKVFKGQSAVSKSLHGPVSIARMSYMQAQRGLADLLFFLAVIGINLGVVNMFPIPILDGGLLAVFAVERIKGSPLSPTSQAVLQYIGLAIIVSLFLYVTFNDIRRLFTGGL